MTRPSSSVATLVVERPYACSAELNDKGQDLYYGKTGGCVVTGNEDGVKAVAMETLYALQHIVNTGESWQSVANAADATPTVAS